MGFVVRTCFQCSRRGSRRSSARRPRRSLAMAGRGLFVLRSVGFHEEVEGGLRVVPGLGHPDILQVTLGGCSADPWAAYSRSIARLMHASSAARGRPRRLGEAPSRSRASPSPVTSSGPMPRQRRLRSSSTSRQDCSLIAVAVGDGDQLLGSVIRGADEAPGLHCFSSSRRAPKIDSVTTQK